MEIYSWFHNPAPPEIQQAALERGRRLLKELREIENEEYDARFAWERLQRIRWRKVCLREQYDACLWHIWSDRWTAEYMVRYGEGGLDRPP